MRFWYLSRMRGAILKTCMYMPLKRQSQLMSSDSVSCLNVLEASFSNSVDPDQTARS